MTATDAAARAERPGYRFYVLAILILVYMLNFLDRQIIGILAAPLKAEFGLSDSQFGLLGGIAFASVYSTLAIPLAWLADRYRGRFCSREKKCCFNRTIFSKRFHAQKRHSQGDHTAFTGF